MYKDIVYYLKIVSSITIIVYTYCFVFVYCYFKLLIVYKEESYNMIAGRSELHIIKIIGLILKNWKMYIIFFILIERDV